MEECTTWTRTPDLGEGIFTHDVFDQLQASKNIWLTVIEKQECIWREKLLGYLSIYMRVKLKENCELWQTVNTTIDKVSKHIF